jgi:hypothetical protein
MKQNNWREEDRTQKQTKTLMGLYHSLGVRGNIPPTKGECSDLISTLLVAQREINEERAKQLLRHDYSLVNLLS